METDSKKKQSGPRTEKSLTIETLYKKVSDLLDKNMDIFQGFTITEVSIDKKLEENTKWNNSYYKGTTKKSNKNFAVSLRIPNEVIRKLKKISGGSVPETASYDIVIKSMHIVPYGNITIDVEKLSETGVSERELKRRKLLKYCKEKGCDNREKKPLPEIVSKIVAITSPHSEIKDDLLSTLNIKENNITIYNAQTERDIAFIIRDTKKEEADIIVLYRGGREDEAMGMFSSEKIIDAIVDSKIPVCAALGHDMDTPFIYTVADQTFSTPSSFGKAITAHNLQKREDSFGLFKGIKMSLDNIISKKKTEIKEKTTKSGSLSKQIYITSKASIEEMKMLAENAAAKIKKALYYSIEKKEIDISNKAEKIKEAKTAEIEKYLNTIKLISLKIVSQAQDKKEIQKNKKMIKIMAIIIIVAIVVIISVIW